MSWAASITPLRCRLAILSFILGSRRREQGSHPSGDGSYTLKITKGVYYQLLTYITSVSI